jgi:hypothetical protein
MNRFFLVPLILSTTALTMSCASEVGPADACRGPFCEPADAAANTEPDALAAPEASTAAPVGQGVCAANYDDGLHFPLYSLPPGTGLCAGGETQRLRAGGCDHTLAIVVDCGLHALACIYDETTRMLVGTVRNGDQAPRCAETGRIPPALSCSPPSGTARCQLAGEGNGGACGAPWTTGEVPLSQARATCPEGSTDCSVCFAHADGCDSTQDRYVVAQEWNCTCATSRDGGTNAADGGCVGDAEVHD